MSNTPALFNAAFLGAGAGLTSRALTSGAAAFYADNVTACLAFAEALDAELGVISSVTQADVDLMQSICSAYWYNRYPRHLTAAEYAPICPPLAAYFTEMRGSLESGGVANILASQVINDSNVVGTSPLVPAADNVALALNNLAGARPYGMAISMFGSPLPQILVMLADQLTASNDEVPPVIWQPPFAVNRYCIGPDNHIYANASTGGNAIRRYDQFYGQNLISRYSVANTAANGMPAFYAQSPQSGIDAWTCWACAGDGARRLTGIEGSTNPAWAGEESLIFAAPSNFSDIAFDSAGNIWGAGTGLSRFDATAAAGVITFDVRFTGGNWPASAAGVAVDTNGDVYYSNYAAGAGSIRAVTAATVAAAVGAGPLNQVPDRTYTINGVQGIQNIIFDYARNLWVSCYDTPVIVMIAAADLTTSGAKTPSIILEGGGAFGDGGATGPATIRFFRGSGPLR